MQLGDYYSNAAQVETEMPVVRGCSRLKMGLQYVINYKVMCSILMSKYKQKKVIRKSYYQWQNHEYPTNSSFPNHNSDIRGLNQKNKRH